MQDTAEELTSFGPEYGIDTDAEYPDAYDAASSELTADVIDLATYRQSRDVEAARAAAAEIHAAETLSSQLDPLDKKLATAEKPTIFQGFHAEEARRDVRSYGTRHKIYDFWHPAKTSFRNTMVRHWESMRRKVISDIAPEADTVEVQQTETKLKPYDNDVRQTARTRLFSSVRFKQRHATKRASEKVARELSERHVLQEEPEAA